MQSPAVSCSEAADPIIGGWAADDRMLYECFVESFGASGWQLLPARLRPAEAG